MAAYATKLAEAFASKVVERYFERSVAETITNQDWEGEIRDKASVLNILTFGAIELKNYTGSNLTADDITESNGQLITDQQKAFYFKIRSLDRFKSYIKNPDGTLLDQVSNTLKETIDSHVLSHWSDAAAGQWDGTAYATGTVEVTTTTGAVAGNGTTFTAAMVGKPFKAAGHTKWYRVKSYASTTSIVIENDSDDETSAYDGGAINAGAAYSIQANAATQVTKATIHPRIVALKTLLDKAKIPTSDRWIVLPADLSNLLIQMDGANPLVTAVNDSYQSVVKNGMIGRVAGFNVYSNEQVDGDSVNGYNVLAGHKSAITYAMGFTESGIEDLTGNFGKAYKGLSVYGSKVVDERRKALAHGFWKL